MRMDSRFTASELLTHTQIASYFTRLAKEQQQVDYSAEAINPTAEAALVGSEIDEEDFMEDVGLYPDENDVLREAINDNNCVETDWQCSVFTD